MTIHAMTVHAFRGTIVDFPPSTVPCAMRVRTDAIVVVRYGRVADVLESGADERTVDARIQALAEEGALVHVLHPNQFLLPGLVDLHIHAPQSTYAGTATDRPLMGADGWLETYTFPAERRMADPSLARQVYDRVVERGLRHGTTTAVYFATIHLEATKALAEACRRRGQRGYVGKVCMDRNAPADYCETTAASLAGARAFCEWVAATQPADEYGLPPLVRPVITPRFVPTCSPELLAGLGKLAAEHKAYVTTHGAESLDEVAYVEALHPGEGNDTAILDKHGLLGRRSVVAHCVHLTAAERTVFAAAGATVASCPLSNFFFANGSLKAKRCLACGVNVGLGTDVAGGYSPSMLSACRSAVVASKAVQHGGGGGDDEPASAADDDVDWSAALWMATRGGANALADGGVPGGFDVGAAFDACVIDCRPGDVLFDGAAGLGAHELVERYVNLGDDRNVEEVWVNGERRGG